MPPPSKYGEEYWVKTMPGITTAGTLGKPFCGIWGGHTPSSSPSWVLSSNVGGVEVWQAWEPRGPPTLRLDVSDPNPVPRPLAFKLLKGFSVPRFSSSLIFSFKIKTIASKDWFTQDLGGTFPGPLKPHLHPPLGFYGSAALEQLSYLSEPQFLRVKDDTTPRPPHGLLRSTWGKEQKRLWC